MNIPNRIKALSGFQRGIALIAVLAFVLRVVWVIMVRGVTTSGSADQEMYLATAVGWATGNYWQDFYRTPLYSLFVAILERGLMTFKLAELSPRIMVGLPQAVISAVMVVMVGLIARRAFRSDAVGLIAAFVLAIWPNQVFQTGLIMSENLATPLFVGAIAVVTLAKNPAQRRVVLLSALLAGLMILVRPSYQLAIIPLAFGLAYRAGGLSLLAVRRFVLYGAVVIAVLMPWLAFVSWSEGRPTYQLATASGFNFCLGNNPAATGTWSDEAVEKYCPAPRGGPGEIARAEEMQAFGLKWMRSNLDEQPRLIGERLKITFRSDSYGVMMYPFGSDYRAPGNYDSMLTLLNTWWAFAVELSVLGIIIGLLKYRRISLWLIGCALASVATVILTVGTDRLHDPVIPIMACFIGLAVNRLVHWFRLLVESFRRAIAS